MVLGSVGEDLPVEQMLNSYVCCLTLHSVDSFVTQRVVKATEHVTKSLV